jgi:copper chaperone NosL
VSVQRRTLLRSIGATLAASASSGCLGALDGGSAAADDTPTPVSLSGEKQDDQGGMVIGKHGGPNGQIFYAENSPEGRENPAWFHTLTYGLFPYYFERKRRGWTAEVVYVTDYSNVDYTVREGGGRAVVSSPTAADTFGDAEAMTYVVESTVEGGMGPAMLPFSAGGDADAFVDEYGGRRLAFGEITETFVRRYQQR